MVALKVAKHVLAQAPAALQALDYVLRSEYAQLIDFAEGNRYELSPAQSREARFLSPAIRSRSSTASNSARGCVTNNKNLPDN